jgi:hypothetical protein
VAKQRQEKFQKIMDLHENNRDGFYCLVRRQRDPKNSSASSFNFEGNMLYGESEIREAWADYFEELATPVNHANYDQDHKLIVEKDVRNLHNLFTDGKIENIEPVTEELVEETILSFKNGKSPDEMHNTTEHLKYGGSQLSYITTEHLKYGGSQLSYITTEHLKYGGSQLSYIFTFIIIFLLKNIHIAYMLLKSGIVCPVFKYGGKPKDDPNSYRNITITSCVGKLSKRFIYLEMRIEYYQSKIRCRKVSQRGKYHLLSVLS